MKNEKLMPYLALIGAPLLWSGNIMIGKLSVGIIPPFSFAFFRWLIVFFALIPFVWKDFFNHKSIILNNYKILIVLSILSVAVYTPFIYLGLHYTSSLNTAFLNATIPAIIIILAIPFLKDGMNIFKFVSIVLSIIGVFIIVAHGKLSDIIYLKLNKGDILVLVASFSWALYSVLLKKYNIQIPSLILLFATSSIGAIFLFPEYVFEYLNGYKINFNFSTSIFIIYAALISSIMGFTFWGYGVKKIGPQKAGYFFNLLPVFNSIISIFFLGEKVHYSSVIGMFFIFLSIVVSNKKINKT